MTEIKNYIDGIFSEPASGEYIKNFSPVTGQVSGKIPKSSKDDALKAIASAKAAFPAWRALPAVKRAEWLRKLANKIKENAKELSKAETLDNGKPISMSATVDIPRAASNLEFFAEATTQYSTEAFDMGDKALNYTLRDPLGVVTCISPWNLPLYLLTWKIAPALAFGNTVVAKPSEVTPLTAYLLSKLCDEIGFPKGVLNIVHGLGSDLGDTLTTHSDVKGVTFTGSTQTGKIIAQNTAPLFKKTSLEMGGKNPNIIFADCDYEKALETTLRSSFANQGQICLCGSRIYIEKPIYEKFKNDLVERTKKLRQGDPLDRKTEQGAVVSKQHFEKVLSCIELAKKEGGKVLVGGEPFAASGEMKDGYYIQPTVIEGLNETCDTNQQEIFGPVVTITPFDSEEQVIEWANSTDYGLAGSLWTKDIDRAHRVARKIDSGILWINTWMYRDLRTPFGGMKSSGVGREGGHDAYRFFTQVKNVCLAIGENENG